MPILFPVLLENDNFAEKGDVMAAAIAGYY
jgi:hypothetical protein